MLTITTNSNRLTLLIEHFIFQVKDMKNSSIREVLNYFHWEVHSCARQKHIFFFFLLLFLLFIYFFFISTYQELDVSSHLLKVKIPREYIKLSPVSSAIIPHRTQDGQLSKTGYVKLFAFSQVNVDQCLLRARSRDSLSIKEVYPVIVSI